MSSDTLVLDYQNACVYRSDLALLESNTAWLNDACIHFQMTRLASGNDPEKQDTNPTTAAGSLKEYSPRIQCLDPSVVSFFMHQLSFEDEDDLDEMKTLCQSWGLPSEYDQKSSNPIIMLLPINDNHGASSLSFQTPGGGTHWSLLLCAIMQGEWIVFHFDSSGRYNAQIASRVANKLQQMQSVCQGENDSEAEEGGRNKSSKEILILECQTPQQTNGYDCGVCTLCNAQAIINFCASDGGLRYVNKIEAYDDDYQCSSHSLVLELKSLFERAVLEISTKKGGAAAMCNSMRKNIASDIRELSSKV